MSARVENNCPTLIKVGPKSKNVVLIQIAWALRLAARLASVTPPE